jgi:hypothetical protein
MYSDWGAAARSYIAERIAELPDDAGLEDRRSALRKDATLFHGGTSWGRKVWSREVRKYLEQHGLPPRTVADISPQSKLHQRTQSGDITFPFRGES